MNKIRLKMKVLEYSQHYTLFFKCSRAASSVVVDGIWQRFKLIQAFMVVLVTYKNDEDPLKNESTRVLTTFSHYKSMEIFSDIQG